MLSRKPLDCRRNDITEQYIVGPVCQEASDCADRYIINQPHNNSEDRQSQPAVGYYTVDLIGNGKTPALFFFDIAALDDGCNVNVTLIGDDTLGVIVQLILQLP